MSAANSTTTNASANANSSTHSTNYPQLSKDATEIIYSWLPHSTALGASSTVTFRVRNASLTDIGPLASAGWYAQNGVIPSLEDEKKINEGELLENTIYYPECRVEASLYGMGLPLQAVPISTRYSPLIPYNNNNTTNRHNFSHFTNDFARGKEWGTSAFDTSISLPVRWRDLTRDACLTINVFCEGDFSDFDGSDNENVNRTRDDDNDQCNSKVWGTTLPLFDQNGRLRSGLHKLRLHANIMADGGMRYQSMGGDDEGDDIVPIETFLEGGATPGISYGDRNTRHSHSGWFDGRKLPDVDDPKWKASLILHELNRTNAPWSSSHNVEATRPTSSQSTSSHEISWLDALTRERCLEVLHEQDDDTDDIYHNEGGVAPTIRPPRHANPAPTSSHHDEPYLIIELPTSPIPILYEESIYPVETSSHLRGTTGSIIASELIKFHSAIHPMEKDGLTVRISPSAMDLPASPALPQSFLYPLLQTLDHEPPLTDENENPLDNPAQDKYRILAHDLIRGLVDPGLKPDRVQRGRLERIIGSPSYHLSTEEKDLLWKFRFSLVDNRRALTKFLLAVDWSCESEVVQAAELLDQWRKRSPIEVTDALKLLGRNVAFQTSLVRSYAIDTLNNAPDEELRLYLLQLVQALKYEENISGGFLPLDRGSNTTTSGQVSSLSTFLIDRASRNIELANYLFWYLRIELENRIYEARYREVFLAFQEKLSHTFVSNGTIISPNQDPLPEPTMSLWQLLVEQEKFISGILKCQRDSLDVRGKKDAKEKHLREALEAGGFRNIPRAVPLPSAPHIWVKGINCNSAKMFKSALYPAVLDFLVAPSRPETTKQSKQNEELHPMYKVMLKTGDDLRQDQLVIMMIQLMERLLKRGTLDLCLRPYSILAMPNNTGLIEFVERSIPVSQILSSHNNSIMNFFQNVAPQVGAPYSVKPDVLQTYIRSCAGYCVLTYLLGVGDRHLDNIMIQPSGNFFHIDFGFIFGRDPKPLPPAFRLTKEMVDGMGGTESKEYRQFCSLACQGFNVLRKSAGLVLNLLHLMSDAGIEDLSHNPSADAIGVISKVEERFKLELTDEQAELFFVGLINESLSALAPRVMEMFHQLSVARR